MSPSPSPILTNRRNIGLDLLRLTAILLVLWSHPPATPSVFVGTLSDRLGPTGVDLFFVLSGFLIGSLLLDEIAKTDGLDVKRFWIRRFLKIVPPYILLVIAGSALNIARNRNNPLDALYAMWPNIVHIQNYVRGDRPLGQTWSLAVEEHFYLALPCVLVTMSRFRTVWNIFPLVAIGVMAASFMSRVMLLSIPYTPQTHIFSTHIRIDNLMLGVLIAWLAKTRHPVLDLLHRNWQVTLIVGVILIGTPCVFERNHPFVFTFGYSLFAIGYALIVILAYMWTVNHDATKMNLVQKACIEIGQCSYSIYLWMTILAGRPLELVAGRTNFQSDVKYWLFLPLYFAWASIVGIVMHRMIEIPINAYRNRIFPRGTT